MFSASKSKGASGSYQIANSLRFRSSASAYLNRTPASASDQKKWTFSAWVKRGQLGATQIIAEAGTSGTTFTYIAYFNASDQLVILDSTVSGVSSARTSTAVFRDPSAWYHIVVNLDAANSVCNGYVNGVAQTFTGTQPSNQNWAVNSAIEHRIGRAWGANTNYFDGYLADINFIDGQALTPSSFGQISTITGVWQPKAYSGTYGTNGFKLNFSNGTSTTTLGYDSSGNGNNWTTNNISLTAGSTYDWMIDSPTPFAGSSYGVGNYSTLNPLQSGSTITLSNANLNVSDSGASGACVASTFAVNSGKWYWEVTLGNAVSYVGMSTPQSAGIVVGYLGSASGQFIYNPNGASSSWIDGIVYNYSTGSTATTNDVIGVAIDFTANTVVFYKNGVSMGTFGSSFLAGRTWSPAFKSNLASTATFNFGQRPFSYTPPSGFKSLCTFNLPTPTIQNGASYMAATTYTGTGSSLSVSNAVNSVSFQPDFVWIKSRSAATDHALYDVIRGTQNRLESNTTDAAVASDNGLTAFGTSGFTVNTLAQVNTNAATYVGWQWKANGTAVTNTAGSISSQVSANTTAGFSVVTYTGTGANATVGHGLGVAPSMVIVKRRDSSTNGDWFTYHIALGNTNAIFLNLTNAASVTSAVWNNTTPTSSAVSIGTSTGVNASGSTYVAYCFAAIAGYSAFGSYTGNGSTDGPFIYTGFRPRFVMVKCSSTTAAWIVMDTARSPYNATNVWLNPDQSTAENSTTEFYDLLSNGFKLRYAGANNASGQTFIYAAFAENPFQNALAR